MTNMNAPQSAISPLVDRNAWFWGFTPQAEIWNGRFAMIGFVSAILVELFSHQGILHFWGLISPVVTTALQTK
jgi:hypothetical protein